MATKRQLIPLLMEDLRKYSPELLEDDTFSLEDDIDFESVLQDLLWDRGLCEGCRNWFSPERSCERETESLRTCINRTYDYLLNEYGSEIIEYMKKAYEAGKNGEEFVVENVEWRG